MSQIKLFTYYWRRLYWSWVWPAVGAHIAHIFFSALPPISDFFRISTKIADKPVRNHQRYTRVYDFAIFGSVTCDYNGIYTLKTAILGEISQICFLRDTISPDLGRINPGPLGTFENTSNVPFSAKNIGISRTSLLRVQHALNSAFGWFWPKMAVFCTEMCFKRPKSGKNPIPGVPESLWVRLDDDSWAYQQKLFKSAEKKIPAPPPVIHGCFSWHHDTRSWYHGTRSWHQVIMTWCHCFFFSLYWTRAGKKPTQTP